MMRELSGFAELIADVLPGGDGLRPHQLRRVPAIGAPRAMRPDAYVQWVLARERERVEIETRETVAP